MPHFLSIAPRCTSVTQKSETEKVWAWLCQEFSRVSLFVVLSDAKQSLLRPQGHLKPTMKSAAMEPAELATHGQRHPSDQKMSNMFKAWQTKED